MPKPIETPSKVTKLPQKSPRSVQETFRVTKAEHLRLVAEAAQARCFSMSDFYRMKVGLRGGMGRT